MWSKFSKKQASASPGEAQTNFSKDATAVGSKSPQGSDHKSSSQSIRPLNRSVTSATRQHKSPSSSLALSLAPTAAKTLEEVQMEADVNKSIVQEMQEALQNLQGTVDSNKELLELSQTDLAKYKNEVKTKDQTIKSLKSTVEQVEQNAKLNKELLEHCTGGLRAMTEVNVMLKTNVEKGSEQVFELQITVQALQDELAESELRMPKFNLTGLIDPQSARDTAVLVQDKVVMQITIDNLQKENATQAVQIKTLTTEASTLREQLSEVTEDLQTKLTNKEKQLANSEQLYKTSYQEKVDADRALEFDRTVVHELRERLADPEKDAAYHQARLEAIRNGGHSDTVRNWDDGKKISELEAKLAKVTHPETGKYAKAVSHIKTMEKEMKLREGILIQQKEKIARHHEQKLQFKENLKDAQAQIARLEAEKGSDVDHEAIVSRLTSEKNSALDHAKAADIKVNELGKLSQTFKKQLESVTKAFGYAGDAEQQRVDEAVRQERQKYEELQAHIKHRDQTARELASQGVAAEQALKDANEKLKTELEQCKGRTDRYNAHVADLETRLRAAEQTATSSTSRDDKIARLEEELRRSRQNSNARPVQQAPTVERDIEQRPTAKITKDLEAKSAAKMSDLQHRVDQQQNQLLDARTRVARRDEELIAAQQKCAAAETIAQSREQAFHDAEKELEEDVVMIRKKSDEILLLKARLVSLGVDVSSSEDEGSGIGNGSSTGNRSTGNRTHRSGGYWIRPAQRKKD